MSKPKLPKPPATAKEALKAGRSFIAATWKPWPKEPSGAWDMGALDRRMSDGVSAVRMLADVVKAQEQTIQELQAERQEPRP